VSRQESPSLQRGEYVNNLILVTEVHACSENAMNGRALILPASDRSYLPAGLQLRILDEQQNMVEERNAGEVDGKIEMLFTSEHIGERFIIQIGLGETSVNENFVA
jgi:hypothetical protein